ncbi:hypothetical protein D3D02_16675 [Halobellus sp. Atlit-38R]|uniref:hypothetical protein n=1 Tax=Halobellus sp. Atlit-38R TaxID=2282131 RepID=UPI000EF1A294|nr:hypothetical protein [Halobellus sp. Atlit-38R]RLM83778.1 hypothetical protein D3D02_16675 [Halobellus sp. Atlit-38R]
MAMQPHFSFDALSCVIEQLGSEGRSVRRAEAAAGGDEDETLRATVDVSVPLCGASGSSSLEPISASTDGDGLCVSFDLTTLSDSSGDQLTDGCADELTVSTCPTDARLDDGAVLVTLDVVIGSDVTDAASEHTAATDERSTTAHASTTNTAETADSSRTADASGAAGRSLSEGRSDRTTTDRDTTADRATTVFGGVPAAAASGPNSDTLLAAGSDRSSGETEPTTATATDSAPVDSALPTNGEQTATVGEEERDAATSDDGPDAADDAASALTAARDDSVPPYEDVEYLRCLYDVCETFAEMSERIEMDVSAETVRRYMIEAEVHSPTSYETTGSNRHSSTASHSGATLDDESSGDSTPDDDTADASASTAEASPSGVGSDDGAGAPPDAGPSVSDRSQSDAEAESLPDDQLVADGIGLPEELTLHDVVDAVVDARTVHEVQRELGLEHGRTRQLLRQLNVLDLVLRRVSDAPERRVSFDDVAARIRQCTPDAA